MTTKALALMVGLILFAGRAGAVPETVSVRVTDVTPTSFAVVWLTDVAAYPEVEVYADASMAVNLAESAVMTAMPDAPSAVAMAAVQKGIMKVRVSGLAADTAYYVRTMTRDPANVSSTSYSSLMQVTTAAAVVPYHEAGDGTLTSLANNLLTFRVFIRPADSSELPGMGDLILLESDPALYPVSAFVGEGSVAPEGVVDLNNLFDLGGSSLDVLGGERMAMRIYRGGTLSTLLHYRRFPADSGVVAAGEPVRGFWADLNLDGNVDKLDFDLFRSHYPSTADDGNFNPDVNFIPVSPGQTVPGDAINARDFVRFAGEYGRTGVE